MVSCVRLYGVIYNLYEYIILSECIILTGLFDADLDDDPEDQILGTTFLFRFLNPSKRIG